MQRTLTIQIDAPPDEVWRILADGFCEVSHWTDTVQRSWALAPEQIPPDVRVAPQAPFPGRMVVTGLGQLAEVLVDWDAEQRRFTFVALGVPGIVTRSADTTSVVALGPGRCEVRLALDMQLWGPLSLFDPLLERRIGRVLGPFLDDLKRHAEGGLREVA